MEDKKKIEHMVPSLERVDINETSNPLISNIITMFSPLSVGYLSYLQSSKSRHHRF